MPHTPGPWRIRTNGRHGEGECDLTICGDIFCLADINGPLYRHCEPNAHLIAAAPELLAALKDLLANIEPCPDDPERQRMLNNGFVRWDALEAAGRAAIAKAEGEG